MRMSVDVSVVLDCNVLLQAAAFGLSPSAACLRLADSGIIRLCASNETLAELDHVLNRDIIKTRFGLTESVIAEFLYKLRTVSDFYTRVPEVFSLTRDPNDEPYINLAVAANADFLITRDKDLLDLMSNYDESGKQFRQRFRPLRVVDPVEFLPIMSDRVEKLRKREE